MSNVAEHRLDKS